MSDEVTQRDLDSLRRDMEYEISRLKDDLIRLSQRLDEEKQARSLADQELYQGREP